METSERNWPFKGFFYLRVTFVRRAFHLFQKSGRFVLSHLIYQFLIKISLRNSLLLKISFAWVKIINLDSFTTPWMFFWTLSSKPFCELYFWFSLFDILLFVLFCISYSTLNNRFFDQFDKENAKNKITGQNIDTIFLQNSASLEFRTRLQNFWK